MNSKWVMGAAAMALTVGACSSRPREFAPRLAAPASSPDGFDAALAECDGLRIAGKLDSEGRLASAGAGAAAGAGLAAAGSAAAVAAGGYAGMAVVAATVVLLPVALVGGAWGMSKMKRAKKEKAIKTVMAGCLKERGYVVAGWDKTGKKAAVAAKPTVPPAAE